MTLQVKILLSYLALGGGAGGIYLGTNGGFGNSAMEGVVEISEPDSNPQLVVVKSPIEEPQTLAENPQNAEVQADKDKEEMPVNDEVIPETKTSEKKEEILTSDETTKKTENSNNNEDAEPKPVLELQAAEEVIAPQPQELKIDIAAPTSKETKESKSSDSIKEPVSEQSTPKTEQKAEKPSLDPKESQCPDQSNQQGKGTFIETMGIFNNGQHGFQWIKCYAEHMRNKNKN